MADSIDYLRYRDDSPDAAARFSADDALWQRLPAQTLDGVAARLNDFAENPVKFGFMVGSAAIVGAGISCLGRNKTFGSTTIAIVPKVMALTAAADVSIRLGVPTAQSLMDHENAATHHRTLGTNLGGLLVDYSILGLAGYGGAKAACQLRGPLGQSALADDLPGFARAFKGSLQRQQLSEMKLDAKLERALENAYKGKRPSRDAKPYIAELDETMAELRKGLSAYLREHRLAPKVGLKWSATDEFSGSSYMWEARIKLDARYLAKRSDTDLAELVGHEYTHVEQDVLQVRRVADRLNLGSNPTQKEMARIRKEIQKVAPEADISNAYLRSVMKLRNGEVLSPRQSSRADELLAETPAYNANIARDDVLLERNKLLETTLETFDTRATKIASELTTKSKIKKYFDHLDPEVRRAVDEIIRHRKQPEMVTEEKQILKKALKDQLSSGQAERTILQTEYKTYLCEQEANTIGPRVAWQYWMSNPGRLPLLATGIPAAMHNATDIIPFVLTHGQHRNPWDELDPLTRRREIDQLEIRTRGQDNIIILDVRTLRGEAMNADLVKAWQEKLDELRAQELRKQADEQRAKQHNPQPELENFAPGEQKK